MTCQSIRQPGLTKKLPGMFLKQITVALIVLALPEELWPLVFHLLYQMLSWFKGVSMFMTLLLRVLLCLEKTFQSRKEMVRFLWCCSSTHPIESGQPCHSGCLLVVSVRISPFPFWVYPSRWTSFIHSVPIVPIFIAHSALGHWVASTLLC